MNQAMNQVMNLTMFYDGIDGRKAAGLTNAAVWRWNSRLRYGAKPGQPC
jgi:hypothetical protein